jgi:hypothetical protein
MALGPSALGAWAPGSGAWAVGSPGPGCHSCVSRRLLARWLLARLLARWQAGLLNRLACWLLISMAPWLVGSWLVGSLARRPPWLVGSFLLPLGSSALGTMALGSVPRSMALDLDGPLARRILARRLLGSSAPWLVGSFLLPLWLLALGHTRARVAPGVRASLARRPLGSSALSFCPFGSWLLVTPARALRRVSAPFPYHGNTHSRAKALGWRVRALSHQDDRRTARVKEKPPVCMAVLRRVGSHAR